MYDPHHAPNRRIKRLIENDNQKERNKERRKFNEKLLELVRVIRDKDKRFQFFNDEDNRVKREKKETYEREREEKR